MKVVTLQGTYEIDLSAMKVRRSDGTEVELKKVPSPVIGQRMELNDETTAPVTEVTR